MESEAESSTKGFQPNEEQTTILNKHFNPDMTICDPHYNSTNICLSEIEAHRRAELVSDIEYTFSLALKKGDNFLGQAEINFYLEQMPVNNEELFINSQALAVSELTINEDQKTNSKYFNGQKIRLEIADLRQGWNVVSLKYYTPYMKNRTGLHQFIDTADGEQYLYSQFEAFHCFRVFPCFDQPSLKAKMTLSVLCPQEWVTVSNGIDTRHE